MIVLDANILLYAYDKSSSHHLKALPWLEKILSGSDPIGLPWQTISAFLRIATNPKLEGNRIATQQAAEIVDQWLEQPNVRTLSPGEDHWRFFRHMLIGGQASGVLVSDAHLAALTLEFGGILHTTDRDFARFPELRWRNPLF